MTLLELITQEHERKRDKDIHPNHTTLTFAASMLGLSKHQVLQEAKELEEQGLIRVGRTINDCYFTVA